MLFEFFHLRRAVAFGVLDADGTGDVLYDFHIHAFPTCVRAISCIADTRKRCALFVPMVSCRVLVCYEL